MQCSISSLCLPHIRSVYFQPWTCRLCTMCGVEMDSVTASAVHHVTAPASACSWGSSGYPSADPYYQSHFSGRQCEPWSAGSTTMSSPSIVQASTTTDNTAEKRTSDCHSDAESWVPGHHSSQSAKSPSAGSGQDDWTTEDDDSCNDENVLKKRRSRCRNKRASAPETPEGTEIPLSMSCDSSRSPRDRTDITPDTPHSRADTDPYVDEPSGNHRHTFSYIPNPNLRSKSYELSPTPSTRDMRRTDSARLARVAAKLQEIVDELRDLAGAPRRRTQWPRSLRSPSPLSSTPAAPSVAASEPTEYLRSIQRREDEKPARPAWKLRRYFSNLHDSFRGATRALHQTNGLSRTRSQKRKTYSREEDSCDGQTDKRFRRI